jgi:hypothetical protein
MSAIFGIFGNSLIRLGFAFSDLARSTDLPSPKTTSRRLNASDLSSHPS